MYNDANLHGAVFSSSTNTSTDKKRAKQQGKKTEPSGSSVEACGNQNEPTGKNAMDCLVPTIMDRSPAR